MTTVSQIIIYPIKSMEGISLKEWKLDRFGLALDRRWMLVDAHGDFITQRQTPELCLFTVSIVSNGIRIQHKQDAQFRVVVPFEPVETDTMKVKVWGDEVEAQLVSKQVDVALGNCLGRQVHLVKMPETALRQVDTRYANNGTGTAFTDGFPLLMIGEASLDHLNSKLKTPVPMRRFRPNLVMRGGLPHQEDHIGKFTIGELEFEGVKPCSRCVVTTIDDATGQKSAEPLTTLATYRKDGDKIMFGMNVIHQNHEGVIKVGEPIRFL